MPLTRRTWVAGAVVAAVLVAAGAAGLLLHARHARRVAHEAPGGGSASAGPAGSGSAGPAGSAGSGGSAGPAGPAGSGAAGADPRRPNCAAKPSACGFPDGANTGVPAGTGLTVVSGDLRITQAGAVVDGKDIRGCVDVRAPKVTIRRSRITCTSLYGIASFTESYQGGGLLVEDVEIDCHNSNTTAVGSYGLTARRLNIHGCENGFDVDTDVTVVDSYMHNFYEGATGHADGVQLAIGARLVVRHNTILQDIGTSALISNGTTNSDVLLAGNLLAGGAYTLYCPKVGGAAYRVVDNRFSRLYSAKSGVYGPLTDCDSISEFTGNVWDDTLQPLNRTG